MAGKLPRRSGIVLAVVWPLLFCLLAILIPAYPEGDWRDLKNWSKKNQDIVNALTWSFWLACATTAGILWLCRRIPDVWWRFFGAANAGLEAFRYFVRLPPRHQKAIDASLSNIRDGFAHLLSGRDNPDWAEADEVLLLELIKSYSRTERASLLPLGAPLETQVAPAENRLPTSSDPDVRKHRILTDFVSYSAVVRDLVDATLRRFGTTDEVVIFGTWARGLDDWFNNQFTFAHPSWVEYLRFWVRAIAKEPRHLCVERCILIHSAESESARANDKRNRGTARTFSNKEKLGNDYRRQILIQQNQGNRKIVCTSSPRVAAFLERNEQIQAKVRGGKENQLGLRDPAYIIGSDEEEPFPPPENFEWRTLGEIYRDKFHSGPQGAIAASYYELTADDIKRLSYDLPEDALMIGLRQISKEGTFASTDWKLILAADFQAGMQGLGIEIITKALNEDRWSNVLRWLTRVASDRTSLKELA